MSAVGYLHSVNTLSTLDGPGMRFVAFLQGCPLHCIYCQNIDAQPSQGGEEITAEQLAARIGRVAGFVQGVTFSGGECLCQADFVREVFERIKPLGLSCCIDTSGCLLSDAVLRLLPLCDTVLLDIKFYTDEEYRRYTGTSLHTVLDFLAALQRLGVPTVIRSVILGGLNDTAQHMHALRALVAPFSVVQRIELLPFSKLCADKYKALALPFAAEGYTTPDAERMRFLQQTVEADR